MKKIRLLLLDANVVLELFALDMWKLVVKHCEVVLASVVKGESLFFEENGAQVYIDQDLERDVASGIVNVEPAKEVEVAAFRQRFKPSYLDRLDDGEAESLTLLMQRDDYVICSSDAIVFKVLGCLGLEHMGLSLEEILQQAGLSKKMRKVQFTSKFRTSCTLQGAADRIRGVALRR